MTIGVLNMPRMGETMEEGKLVAWLVEQGQPFKRGEEILEVETDKTIVEFPALGDGVITETLVEIGELVEVGTPIARVDVGDGPNWTDDGSDSEPEPSEEANISPPASSAPSPAPAPAPVIAEAGGSAGGPLRATPLARRIARIEGLELSGITGTGRRGRIMRSDVEAAALARDASASDEAASPVASAAMPSGATAEAVKQMFAARGFEEVQLDGMRKTVAARLTEAKQTIPHFYLRREINLDALLAFRSKLNGQLEARGVKLSVNDFVIKACALALQRVPAANAVWAGDRILRLRSSDVAVAVAIEGGLFTPVLRAAEMKSLSALSAEMKDLAARARDRRLVPEEYRGGSFAISNLGMFGIDSFDAVINPPHGAILAVGAGKRRPAIGKDGELTVATIMSVTLSVDHRVIDGAVGAELLGAIVDNLENPLGMLA
ncbi:dihydrolipoamide acetyltransferase family protein [Aliiruegeria lutimaris]|uniref:Dihydrolipoamide acetyltransferase component of pyruvate dehydrogenase complex n=1 Tax=Aliiruegeria lutimaris TaxID=571298 RepID=A0A1G8RZF8_9RHOB|nr:dihydrolipoamide acetyltransferase family protein [Aliiruegeria lutimaris]SDJ22394.1 pyruvate dehydrogenase E2 component (dihydrolipoamide acetyltransferase) [Aliiruegeria lutimaris]